MLGFKGTEKAGKFILNFLRHCSYDFFHIYVSKIKIPSVKMYYTLTSTISICYTVLHVSVTGDSLNWTAHLR